MAEEKQVEHCVSCNVRLTGEGAVKFKCPMCGADTGQVRQVPAAVQPVRMPEVRIPGAVIPWEM